MAMRHRCDEALTARRASIKPRQIGLCSRFINEDKIFGVQIGLACTPFVAGPGRYPRGLVRRRAMTFFERQSGLPQPFPEATDADLHIVFRVFRHEPGLQFGKRRIGFAHDAGAQSFVMCGKLRLGTACPRARVVSPVLFRRPRSL